MSKPTAVQITAQDMKKPFSMTPIKKILRLLLLNQNTITVEMLGSLIVYS